MKLQRGRTPRESATPCSPTAAHRAVNDPSAGGGFSQWTGVPRHITGFHQDEHGDWVAELECGHGQHVRHDPPWQQRPWITTDAGRAGFIGTSLFCVRCGDPDRPDE